MAGTIDQLNFEIILDDKKFRDLVETDLKLAQQLNTDLTAIFNLKAKLDAATTKEAVNAEKVAEATAKRATQEQKLQTEMAKTALQQQKVATETERTRQAQEKNTSAVKATNTALTGTSSILRTITQLTGVYFGAMGVRRLLSSLIDITGQFEVQRMALRNMLQDVDGADKIFEDLYRFSSESTYRFSELAKYAKQLAAFNIDQNSLLETTKMLGDVASGVGVSMDRIILAYGHVKSSGFLRGIQLRSFSQNGVPVLEELSKILTEIEHKSVSLGDVFDRMMKRQVTFEMVEQAFKNMTSEGGKFYQMQEVLAKTLAGQINILKGRWENLLAAYGQANSGVLKDVVSWLSNTISSMENMGRLLRELAIGFGAYQAALVISIGLTQSWAAAMNVGLLGALKKVAVYIASNPYALLAASIAVATTAIYKLCTQMSEVEKIEKVVNKATEDYTASLASENAELDRLYTKLSLVKEGTKEYDAAKRAIESRFGPYLQQLRDEGVAVGNLASTYQDLKAKVEAATRAKFLDAAGESLRTQLDASSKVINQRVEETLGLVGSKLSEGQKEILSDYVFGIIDELDPAINSVINYLDKGGDYNGPYSGGTYNHTYSFRQLRSQYESIVVAYSKGMDKIEDRFQALNSVTGIVGGSKPLEGWRKSVHDALEGVKDDFKDVLTPKQDEDYFEYLERVGKHYKEVHEYKDKALKADKQIYQEEIDAIKGVDKALEGNILMDARYNKTPWRGSSSGNPNKDAISDLKFGVSILEKYRSAFEKLEPYFGEETNEQLAKIFGGDASDYANLDEQIGKLVESLRKLGKEGNEAADAIEARLGTDAVSQIVKSQKEVEKQQKALEKYETTLRKWMGEDFNLGGSGFEFDINKVYSDFNSTLGKIQEKYIQAVKQAEAAHKGNTEAIEREKQVLAGLRDAEIEYERAKSQDRMDKLAESYLKDQYFMRGISMDDLSRLSLKQLSNLKKELNDISREALQMKNQFSGVEGFVGTLGMKLGELTEEDFEELKRVLPEAEVEMVSFANSVKATGLSFDKLVAKIQEAIKKGLENLSEEEKKSIARMAKYAATEVLELAKAFGELGDAMDDAHMREAANSMQELGSFAADVAKGYSQGGVFGAILGGVISIGTKIIGDMAEGAKKQAELAEAIKEAALAYEDALDDTALGAQSGIFGTNTIGKLQAYLSILNKYGRIISDFHQVMSESFGSSYTRDYADENGNLLMDKLKADLEAGLFSGDQVDEVIHAIEKYKEALEEVDGIIESVFSNIASSAADKIVDSWVEASNAALDYADILDDVARSYSKMLIQSMIMETALDPITDDLKSAFTSGRYEDAMAMVANAMQAIQDATPMYEEILSAFDPYFTHGDSGSNSLGSGIKSITEDTANLLASYINAIRADVSVMRGLQESGWESISTAVPTMNDYLNRVAANTFDTAQNTQRILSELQSVIGAPGTSGMVVRVERM